MGGGGRGSRGGGGGGQIVTFELQRWFKHENWVDLDAQQ